MTSKRILSAFGAAAFVLAFHLSLVAQAGDPLVAIQTQLSSSFKISKLTADRSDIVTVGDVVQLHKPGLVMYAVASPLPPSNSYKNGKITKGWGGFGKDFVIGMATPGGGTAASYQNRQFVADEKCFVTGIQVQKDGVLFQLYSDPYDDVRYYANLKILFPDKKAIPTVGEEMKLIAEVLTVDGQDNQGGPTDGASAPQQAPAQAGGPGKISGQYLSEKNAAELMFVSDTSVILLVPGANQNPGQFTVSGDTLSIKFPNERRPISFKIQGDKLISDKGTVWDRKAEASAPVAEAPAAPVEAAAPQAPLTAIAPPPPPPDAPPPTVEVGQTKDQVTAILGQPVKAAKVGTKEFYYYKDMKVTFVNGKVSNIE